MDDPYDDSDSDVSGEESPLLQLRNKLKQHSRKSAFAKTPHEFVPDECIDQIITRGGVLVALNITEPTAQEKALVQFILERAKRIFAVAVFAKIDVKVAIEWFKSKDIDDSRMPIPRPKTKKRMAYWQGDFYDCQWRFSAPVFMTENYSHDFVEAQILPFVAMSRVSGEGAFGEVSRIEIHPSHTEPKLIGHDSFAVKEIRAQQDSQGDAEHWEREVKALRMMNELCQTSIVRFITAFRRLCKNGEEHYVMFEWADGGNLRGLWENMPSPMLSGKLVQSVINELLGLATALAAAHNLENSADTGNTGASYRHGDLKPENILVFKSNGPIGKLKIGDWGEAKYQGKVTAIRPSRTTTRFGTRRYEAPEVELGVRASFLGQSTKRRSRLSDIWAMGCITLEFVVWLLYGLEGLNQFNHDVHGDTFYQIRVENGKKVAQVHNAAISWMDRMSNEPVCKADTNALMDLISLVRNELLVVKLPTNLGSNLSSMDPGRLRKDSGAESNLPPKNEPALETLSIFDREIATSNPSITLTPADPITGPMESFRTPLQPEPEPRGSTRCKSHVFRDSLEIIVSEDAADYWKIEKHLVQVPTDLAPLVPDQSPEEIIHSVEEYRRGDYASPELDENHWKLLLDNTTALRTFSALQKIGQYTVSPAKTKSNLCESCSVMGKELRKPAFFRKYDVQELRVRASANQCDLCRLLWRTCERNGAQNLRTIQFDRERAFVKMDNNSHNAVLSMVSIPEPGMFATSDRQVGFVELPGAGTSTHLGIIRQWLHDCDTHTRQSCKPSRFSNERKNLKKAWLPTRLIDVADDKHVYLWETVPHADADYEWVALSHRWGDRKFTTTRENLKDHIDGLRVDELPSTFRDAVIVTRALGKRFLWIDSLCIIQGQDGDFQTEAEHMADVYSGAYCVIAASCAAHHYDGFLKQRRERDHVVIPQDGENRPAYYLCETIDSFKKHVLDGALKLRGWVLQEHALARRTIFFTEHQTYFECKDGVRCETSTKLKNEFADFLGDPKFPSHLLKAKRGEKINRIQKLYKDYSRLGFTEPYDRPVAIRGLEQRLIETINVQGGFGVIEDRENPGWLRRSLLWCRGLSNLTRIVFPEGRAASRVPSWSWMAYDGGIDFLRPDFGNYDWDEIESPWSRDSPKSSVALIAKVWEYDIESAGTGEAVLTFDNCNAAKPSIRLCAILGRAKGSLMYDTRRHWVLVIAPTTTLHCDGNSTYERIGAGFLPGRCLSRIPYEENAQIH